MGTFHKKHIANKFFSYHMHSWKKWPVTVSFQLLPQCDILWCYYCLIRKKSSQIKVSTRYWRFHCLPDTWEQYYIWGNTGFIFSYHCFNVLIVSYFLTQAAVNLPKRLYCTFHSCDNWFPEWLYNKSFVLFFNGHGKLKLKEYVSLSLPWGKLQEYIFTYF